MILRPRVRRALLALFVVLFLFSGVPAAGALAQQAWAPEPTYRYAGAYRGEWFSEMSELALTSEAGSGVLLFSPRPGRLRGVLELEVACDGAVRVVAEGQTDVAPSYTALVSGPDGLRLLEARLDLATRVNVTGRLASRLADSGQAHQELVVEEQASAPAPGSGASPPGRRWYAADVPARWRLEAGEPGRLRGTWEGAADLAVPGDLAQPGLRMSARGGWAVARQSVEWCPWRGRASARGALVEGQVHEETVELTFRPTGDGRLAGEGSGQASVFGGTPGGCQYSGGGGFAVRVSGEYQAGRFRVRLGDDEMPQLLVTTTCPSGRYVAPQGVLATAFGVIELAERPGARGEATADTPAARGMLELVIEPLGELAPP